jgi:hypothetical protein
MEFAKRQARASGQKRSNYRTLLEIGTLPRGQRRAKVTVSPQLPATNGVSVRFR